MNLEGQFDRAVEIVQGLPKTGPIQTDYEEKLTMYSLYKQATVGNVRGQRPGMFDMLGRAKWDAWAKHKDLDSTEAKWLYVEALLKVLRKYSDKTVAMSLVQELETYGGDPSDLVMSRSLLISQSRDSSSSGSNSDRPSIHRPAYPLSGLSLDPSHDNEEDTDTSEEEDEEEEPRRIDTLSQPNRPPSSLSSHRYRTPIAGSQAMSPPLPSIPSMQPLPTFETPSAFVENRSSSAQGTSLFNTGSTSSYIGQYSGLYRSDSAQPIYPAHPNYRGPPQAGSTRAFGPQRPASGLSLEHAVENVQANIAALSERLDSLQTVVTQPSASHLSLSRARGLHSPAWGGNSPIGGNKTPRWDLDDLGLWSYVVQPVARGVEVIRQAATFFSRNENRTPSEIILRRLCLDVSFLLSVLFVIRVIWRKSGVRRREVKAALAILLRAILGTKERKLVDRGV